MEQNTQQTPVPVQVVTTPVSSPEERFMKHLENMGHVPTLTEGDRQVRPPEQRQQAPQAPQEAQEPTEHTAAPAEVVEDESIEIDFQGGRYQLPKELKELHDGYLRQQDYTVKQQEIAELRRSAEAALQQSRAQQELQTALAPHVQSLTTINDHIAQYSKVDWNALFQQDAAAAQQHSMQFSVLLNRQKVLERAVQDTAQSHMRKVSDAQAALMEASDKTMAQKVRGWTRDSGKALNDFARKQYGFTEAEVNSTLDPRALLMMRDAKQWQDLQSSKAKTVVAPEKTLKPGSAQPSDAGEKQAGLRRAIKVAKTDGARDRAAEALLMSRMR